MTVNEKKLVSYLKKHEGETMSTAELIINSGCLNPCPEEFGFSQLMDLHMEACEIAEKHGYMLDDGYPKDALIGYPTLMPFTIVKL